VKCACWNHRLWTRAHAQKLVDSEETDLSEEDREGDGQKFRRHCTGGTSLRMQISSWNAASRLTLSDALATLPLSIRCVNNLISSDCGLLRGGRLHWKRWVMEVGRCCGVWGWGGGRESTMRTMDKGEGIPCRHSV